MANSNQDYQSTVKDFLEKPWRGNSPTGPVRAQLSSLQASLVRLFQDCVASKDEKLTTLATQLLTEYSKVFDEGGGSLLEFADILSRIDTVLSQSDQIQGAATLTQSLKNAVVQLIDLARTQQDEILAHKLLGLVNQLTSRNAVAQ